MRQSLSFPWGKLPPQRLMRRQAEGHHRTRSFRRLFPLPLRGSCRRSRLRERAHRRWCICSHPGLSPSAARRAAPPSQRAGQTRRRLQICSLSPLLPLRRHLPRGEGRGARLRRSVVVARYLRTHRSHAARAERGSACGTEQGAHLSPSSETESPGRGAAL
jgi:hypothetical protein